MFSKFHLILFVCYILWFKIPLSQLYPLLIILKLWYLRHFLVFHVISKIKFIRNSNLICQFLVSFQSNLWKLSQLKYFSVLNRIRNCKYSNVLKRTSEKISFVIQKMVCSSLECTDIMFTINIFILQYRF